jgi:preprotein translocase subunit SecE
MNLKNIPNKIITFLKETRMEMNKVNWLTKNETVKYTLIIIVISTILAIFLGTLDFIFIKLLNEFIL